LVVVDDVFATKKQIYSAKLTCTILSHDSSTGSKIPDKGNLASKDLSPAPSETWTG
jgi:hypothetical protein